MTKREDQDFLDWLSYQASWLDGAWSETDEAGEQRNVPCHVRRAGEERTGSAAGTADKPSYSAVPMTDKQHRLQSNQGELACIMAYTNYPFFLLAFEGANDVEKAKDAFDKAAKHYVGKWRAEIGTVL